MNAPFSTHQEAHDSASGENANAVIFYAAIGAQIDTEFEFSHVRLLGGPTQGGLAHVIGGISYSYSAAPMGGRLTVEDAAGNVVFDIDITDPGPGEVLFMPALRSGINAALIITLYAGGAGVKGKVNAIGHHTKG